ncbi:placenta-specific gene 8 protein-like [Callorhinchus milii]|uniref:Placenta-specific 8 n=1 Tax=Callorhinchus milii TaxID=7868 RepID=A0A4W3HP34_CALMI|nr:placenta-specific gene 8 protein-like [Callorhinchus milii]|eukprot:gi/632943780/ref/XP_007887141.1/ PREDICTED: placenta-specific gene 8 protein-like [Callorhinchus milii]
MAQQSNVVIVNQPMLRSSQTEWNSSLLNCCDDVGICFCGLLCPCWLSCQITNDLHECCCCGTSVAMRTLIRTKYNIQGSICNDYCATMFCLQCSLCQLKREIKHQM